MDRNYVLSDDTDPLEQLSQLCGHRWDSHLLLQLTAATAPLRRAHLAAGVTRAAGQRISDGQLDRTIRRLVDQQLVRYSLDVRGHKVYLLTPQGEQHVNRLRWLIQQLDPTRDANAQHARRRGAGRMSKQPVANPTGAPNGSGFAQLWSSVLQGTGSIPLTQNERHRVLTTLAEMLHTALAADKFDPAAGRRVGARLVEVGFAAPEALGRTITTLSTRLVSELHLPDPAEASARMPRLVESLAVGFIEAKQDRTLNAQDAVQAAAMRAHSYSDQSRRKPEVRHRHHATHDPARLAGSCTSGFPKS